MSKYIPIEQIFSGIGLPEATYVAQDNGGFERQLRQGIKESGTLCLVTGSSKTGKTTLYNKVLAGLGRVPLIVRSDATVDSDEFWKKPLEKVDFNRLREVQDTRSVESKAQAKIGGEVGWKWLAGLIGEVSLGITGKRSESEIREVILSKPSPAHLVPLLKHTNAILVVEDFHYLTEATQQHIFQQWKVFTDEGVSVIVVGTTHHGVDLAYANPDLVGRIQQIDLKRWDNKDLEKIVTKGFEALKISCPPAVSRTLSSESAGLPIITQQASAQLFADKDIEEVKAGAEINFSIQNAFDALHHVAVSRYKQFESWYLRLKTGPRKRARKYNTYELILSIFELDPPKFELARHEISERLSKLPVANTSLPPAASVNSTLSALETFQKKNGFELLEWSKKNEAIYILEPAFLFYLRWKEEQTGASFDDIKEVIRQVLESLNIKSSK
ncbi:hypothetical protein [Marinobacter sp. M5B]|uniref:hypothetical protein n=1 Tax=Marinobacter TaxID=2742 RepID=UPI0036D40FF7